MLVTFLMMKGKERNQRLKMWFEERNLGNLSFVFLKYQLSHLLFVKDSLTKKQAEQACELPFMLSKNIEGEDSHSDI